MRFFILLYFIDNYCKMIEDTENATQLEDVSLITNSNLKVKTIRKYHISLPWYKRP